MSNGIGMPHLQNQFVERNIQERFYPSQIIGKFAFNDVLQLIASLCQAKLLYCVDLSIVSSFSQKPNAPCSTVDSRKIVQIVKKVWKLAHMSIFICSFIQEQDTPDQNTFTAAILNFKMAATENNILRYLGHQET